MATCQMLRDKGLLRDLWSSSLETNKPLIITRRQQMQISDITELDSSHSLNQVKFKQTIAIY